MISFDSKTGVYTSSLIPIHHGFGTKQYGDGREKRSLIRQTHSVHIHEWKQADKAPISNCDGIITQVHGKLLSVLTADCVPIIFYDTEESIVGISHQGWKGTLQKLPQKMISRMKELGSTPANIKVIIGPAINQCCYEVGAEVVDTFTTEFSDSSIFSRNEGRVSLNLLKANYHTIVTSGILQNNIDYFPFCTSCQEKQFWSYRRDHGIEGEMLSFVMI